MNFINGMGCILGFGCYIDGLVIGEMYVCFVLIVVVVVVVMEGFVFVFYV